MEFCCSSALKALISFPIGVQAVDKVSGSEVSFQAKVSSEPAEFQAFGSPLTRLRLHVEPDTQQCPSQNWGHILTDNRLHPLR